MSKKSRSRSARNPGHFPADHCGNRKGRPKGTRVKPASVFDVLLEKTLTVTGPGGLQREMTIEEALQQRTYADALANQPMAMRQVTKWIMKREAWLAKHAPRSPSRPAITRLISPDPDNADAALVLLGIAAANPARAGYGDDRLPLLLEHWATQAAISRRRGGKRLTEAERDWIRRCTRNPDSLRWPRGTGE